MTSYKFLIGSLCLIKVLQAEEPVDEQVVVIADRLASSFTIESDPKQPTQPIPSFDAASYLKVMPGVTVARKGGNGGDVSLRGQSGSRVQFSINGQQTFGTCGGRMDPPTSYISPQAYDEVLLIKGPQSVKYGAVGSAGTVVFSRSTSTAGHSTYEYLLGSTLGSYGRLDAHLEASLSENQGFIWVSGNSSKSDDYKDGQGQTVPSQYERYQGQAALGWSAYPNHVVEISVGASDGHAHYADRANRARKIAQEQFQLTYKGQGLTQALESIDALCYVNQNRHIMDSFHVGQKGRGAAPERLTQGGRLAFKWAPSAFFDLDTGVDGFNSQQKMRTGHSLDALLNSVPEKVYRLAQVGAFSEARLGFESIDWVSGLRLDISETELFGAFHSDEQPSKKQRQLLSGFTRLAFEPEAFKLGIGLGHAERAPDYWETLKASKSLLLDTEKTTQLDVNWVVDKWLTWQLSAFYGLIDDFILIDKKAKPMARNIDARLFGGELTASKLWDNSLTFHSSLAYTHGENLTDRKPLAQVSPLEWRVALDYQWDKFSVGAFSRWVAAQKRIAIGQGSVVGQDLGTSESFLVFSLHAEWQLTQGLLLIAGIDNLFNKTYAEHISKAALPDPFLQAGDIQQVNEPGRIGWLSLTWTL